MKNRTTNLSAVILLSALFANAQPTNFDYAKRIGGGGEDEGLSITLDQAGNIYGTGTFSGIVDFDPGPGVANLTSAGGTDVFISKLDASGNFIWAKSMGGAGNDVAYSINLDASGNVYSSGWFNGTADFDPGTGVAGLTSNGSDDIYISKLDNSGSFVWAKVIGGPLSDQGVDLEVNQAGGIYLTGIFKDTVDFDPGAGVTQVISNGGYDIFLLKLFSNGNLDWVQHLGGPYDDDATSLAIGLTGDLFLCTSFRDTVDFDPGLGITSVPSKGGDDIAISKFNSSGNFIWTKSAGGFSDEKPLAVTVDGGGNIILTGYFGGTVDFDPSPGVANLSSSGFDDIFVLKLDPSGQFAWAKNIGGNGYDYGIAIDADVSGNIYITGFFSNSLLFPTGTGNYSLSSAGQLDILVAILDSSGGFVWATGFGSAILEGGRDVIVNSAGEPIVIGGFGGTIDFDPGSGIANLTSTGNSDVFYFKMRQTVTGAYEIVNANDFSVYPNPTSGLLNIKTNQNEKLQVEICSTDGRIILSQKINSEEPLELNGLPPGFYYLKAIAENTSFGLKKIQIIK